MKNLLLSLAAMGSCLLAAAPRAYPEVSSGEARLVIGAGCCGMGDPISVCACACDPLDGKSNGVAQNGNGKSGTGSIRCQCAPATKKAAVAGTCGGGDL